MSSSNLFLLSFAIGAIWSLATLLLGGLHGGHGHSGGHGSHGTALSGRLAHGQGTHSHGSSHSATKMTDGWTGTMLSPSAISLFLTWFGAAGFLLMRHSPLGLTLAIAVAVAVGILGAFLVAAFIRFLRRHESPLNPLDYQMVGLLGRVSSPIRRDGVGELIYLRNGARTPLPARSEEGLEIERGAEVIVTRFAKGIAFVRTWDAMRDESAGTQTRRSGEEEKGYVG